MTRIRFVLHGFFLFSALAGTQVVAQSPKNPLGSKDSDASPVAQGADTASPIPPAELKRFRLILTYHGNSDKSYYNLILAVQLGSQQKLPNSLVHEISEDQAAKLIRYLSASGFFKHARVTDKQNDPDTGPQYLLRVTTDQHREESLGWDLATFYRLDGLRKVLVGDAAKSMDVLLGRLAGDRRIWELGETKDGLKTTLSSEKKAFAAGQPILVKLEITNVSSGDLGYSAHHVSANDWEIQVIDEDGRKAPYLGGTAQVRETQTTLKPGASEVIESFDLAASWYLRRPGRYSVMYRGGGTPRSNSLSFEVTANDAGASDGDPIGRLLPLVHGKWLLVANPNASGKVRPGGNREEATGRQVIFQDNPSGYKPDMAIVWLWLTDEPAAESVVPAERPPVSEYLGKISRWHVYIHAPTKALERWPTLREDIKKALAGEKPKGARTSATKPTADDYRLLHDRYRAKVFAAAQAGDEKELAALTDKFNDAIGGKLILVRVALHGDPKVEPKVLLQEYYDRIMFAPGVLPYVVGEKALVVENAKVAVVATNPREAEKWPDDLQMILVMRSLAKEDIPLVPAAPKWGEVTRGLRTRLGAAKQAFRVGEPIPVTLEIANVGTVAGEYRFPLMADAAALHVVDERGREVRYLGEVAMIPVGPQTPGAGELRHLRSCDLTKWHDLTRPGRYSARYATMPVSAPFEFEVIAPPADDTKRKPHE